MMEMPSPSLVVHFSRLGRVARRGCRPSVLYTIYILHVVLLYAASPHETKEYCEAETFNPACERDEVVVVQSALYGRMRVKTCVRTDYGYVGCHVDVLNHIDSKCSGRRTCKLRIPDQELDDTKPCPQEFKTYLEASYTCVRVEQSQCDMCQSTHYAKVSQDKGYLASVITEEDTMDCGSARCPWRVELQPGQKINLTLFDFGIAANKQPYSLLDSCFRYAVVKEKGVQNTPICGGRNREIHVYTSKGHVVDITIVSPEVFGKRGQFMLYYEALGCPTLSAPKNSWSKKESGGMTFGCIGSDIKWSMRCRGTTWDGTMGDCEGYGPGPEDTPTLTLSLGVLIAIIIGIALVIGVFILTVGLVCLKRQQRPNFRGQDTNFYLRTRRESDYPEDIPSATLPLQYTKKEEMVPHDGSRKPQLPGNIRENVYMESRPLPSIPTMSEAEEDARSEKSSKVQVYRTSSGREHYHNPRLVVTPRPTPPPSAEPKEDPQYFVLDPDEMTTTCEDSMQSAGCSSAMPPPPRRPGRGGIQSDKQKSPEEENAENFSKEVLNSSCQEIPTLHQHYEASLDCNTQCGNSSWP